MHAEQKFGSEGVFPRQLVLAAHPTTFQVISKSPTRFFSSSLKKKCKKDKVITVLMEPHAAMIVCRGAHRDRVPPDPVGLNTNLGFNSGTRMSCVVSVCSMCSSPAS